MTQVTIDASSDLPLLQDNIIQLTQKLGDLTPLMDEIGGILESSTQKRFNDKQAPSGVKWADLLPSTQDKKGNNNILIQSGDLMASITHHANATSTTVGTPKVYGVYHQFGTSDMKERPFLGLSDEDKTDIYDLINEHLTGD